MSTGPLSKKLFGEGPLSYQYYDTPEGQDCDKKLLYLTSRAAYIGTGVSMYCAVLNKSVVGIPNHLLFMAKWTIPFTAVAAAYGIGTCVAASTRRKDDYWNNIAGATFAGSVCGAWRRNFGIGFGTVLAIMGIVVMKKKAMEYNLHGGKIWAPPTPPVGQDRLFYYGNNTAHYDFSLAHKSREN